MRVALLFLLLLLVQLSFSSANSDEDGFDGEDDGFVVVDVDSASAIPPPRTSATTATDSAVINPFQMVEVAIAYCGVQPSGKHAFEQVQDFLQTRFPQSVRVTGTDFPLTIEGQLAMAMARVVQATATVFVLAGPQLVERLGWQNNAFAQKLLERKMQLLAASFLANAGAQAVAKSEAFEISINGEPVFSKLATKRMPTFDELARALQDHGVVGIVQDQYQILNTAPQQQQQHVKSI